MGRGEAGTGGVVVNFAREVVGNGEFLLRRVLFWVESKVLTIIREDEEGAMAISEIEWCEKYTEPAIDESGSEDTM